MREKDVKFGGGGIGFGGALFILFLGLKLCHVIDWDWIWIFAPLWVPFAVVFGIILIVLASVAFVGGLVWSIDYLFCYYIKGQK